MNTSNKLKRKRIYYGWSENTEEIDEIIQKFPNGFQNNQFYSNNLETAKNCTSMAYRQLYMQHCSICQVLFESTVPRIVCASCEVKVMGNLIPNSNITHVNANTALISDSIQSPVNVNNSMQSPVNVNNSMQSPVKVNNSMQSPVKVNNSMKSPVKVDNSIQSPVKVYVYNSHIEEEKAVSPRPKNIPNFNLEMRRTTKLKKSNKFNCDFCNRKFQNTSLLQIHMRTHTGEKPFTCSDCGKSFSQSSSLNTHRKLKHSTEKPYKCNVCGKEFAILNYLNVHFRTHTREKPYKCTICNKFYSQKSSLGTHMKTYH